MAINFNQDIAPLRQQYFPMLTGERSFDQAMKYRQEVMMPMMEMTMKMEDRERRIRRDELAYKQQKMAFRQQRDALRREREYAKTTPMIEDRLREIRTSEATPMEKREAFTDLAMSNISLINSSPTISSLFNFQDKLLQSRMAADAKQQQKIQGMRNLSANDYRQGTLRTGYFDEDVYKGILSGEVSDQQVADELSRITTFTKRQEEEGKKKKGEDPSFELAGDIMKKLESVSLGEGYDEDTKEVYSALKPEDYDEYIDDLIRLRGLPLRGNRAATMAEYPEKSSRDLIKDLRALADERIRFSQSGQTSLLTPKAEQESFNISSAFGQTT
jgi:hypothetical protein